MAITFTRALAVEEGQKVTSTQLKTLARAFADRFRAFAFCPWRVCWFWHNLWRQVRNPGAGGLVFPPQGEFFHIYQHLDPEYHGGTTWPVAGPGENEGANLANPMMQFVFGIDPVLDSEDVRINDVFATFLPTMTLSQIWELGKAQRGVVDPINNVSNTPAYDVAQALFQITQPTWSPHGKALGGWLPQPVQLLANCGATNATGLGIPSYELKWTSLSSTVSTTGLHGTISTNPDGTKTVTYAGTCPCGTDSVALNHIIGYAAFSFAWYVAVVTDATTCAYAVDRFDRKDWIEGPYEGQAVLLHTEGKQLQRALWTFAAEFRGTPAQRTPDMFRIRKLAFDHQDFWTRQYPLAPNKGVVDGDEILALYPRTTWTVPANGTVPQGTFGTFEDGTTSRVYAASYVVGGVFVNATRLRIPTSLSVRSGTALLATITLTPDANGVAQAIHWLKNASYPDPLRVELAEDALFLDSAGTLYAEFTEQVAYKPEFWDAALVTRVSASAGGIPQQSGVDGRGLDDTDALTITDNFFRYGCLVNTAGVRDQGDWVNDNPVFDAARRLSRDHVRIMRRQELVSYEVVGGKSVFRFKRFAYGLNNIRADLFKDIAPPIDAVTDLVEGETYIVRGFGSVTYRGATYVQNQTFTSTSDLDFLAHNASLYVYDGIRHAALRKGFSNEWTFFVESRCYHPSGSSIWKPTAYSDYFTFCQRCHFYSGTGPTSLRRFASYNHTTALDADFNPVLNPIALQAQFISPEVPDQFNYTDGANQTFGSANFYSSCQILNRPYEIESCVVDNWQDDQIIKVTLTGRLRSHPNAPATVAADPLTWSAGDITTLRGGGGTPEDYRTDDNAVREYVLSEVNGNYPCTFKTGDAGTGSGVTSLTDNPFGSCYPVFFFARIPSLPYDDGNDVTQAHDSRCLIDQLLHMEVCLRAMCEGFVDGRTSIDIICDTGLGGLYDYTYENLCFEAFSGRDIGAFELAARSDRPGGFGPLPNTRIYAEVFNRLVAAVNLLDKVRLDIPIQFAYRIHQYSGTRDISAQVTNTSGTVGCTETGVTYGYADRLPAPVAETFVSTSGWLTASSFGASQSALIDGCPFRIDTTRSDIEFRAEINPAYINAIPTEIRDMIDLGQTGFLASVATVFSRENRSTTTDINASEECCLVTQAPCPGKWFDPGPIYHVWNPTQTSSTVCALVTSGTVVAPPLPPNDYMIGRNADFAAGSYCSNGPTSSITYTLIADQDAFLQVPLV